MSGYYEKCMAYYACSTVGDYDEKSLCLDSWYCQYYYCEVDGGGGTEIDYSNGYCKSSMNYYAYKFTDY